MAEKKFLVGIDIGTEGSKGIITDFSGKTLAFAYGRHDISRPKPGWAEHDAEKIWWEEFKSISRNLLEKARIDPAEIMAIGCSALSPDMLPVNGQGEPLRPAILYGIDTRTSDEIELLNRSIGVEKIYQMSRFSLSSQAIGPKILWLKRHEPEVFRAAARFLTGTSYLTYKLTGVYTIDYCNAVGFAPMFDFARMRWDEAMCETVGITPDQLPRLCPATEIVGEVTARAAEETGLCKGTPVINGTGDFASELLSTGAYQGDTILTYGSTMLIFSVIGNPVFNPSLNTLMFPVSGTYMFGGAPATSGSITRWFRDNLGGMELEAEKRTGADAYQLLSQEAELIPAGSEGLVLLPYFSGERSPIFDEKARGAILGLTLSHTKAHLYRAILEGIAYSVKHNVDIIEESGVPVHSFISVGSGTKSKLWVQIVSDVTGVPQQCIPEFLGSPLGNAYLAGYGAGVFKDIEPLRTTWVKTGEIVEPNRENNKIYQDYYQIYRSLYPHMKQEMHRIAELTATG